MIETKFKQTEIGLIPEDWEKSSVGELFLHINSNSLSRDCLNYEGGIAKNVHYGDVLVKFGEVTDAEKDDLPYINDKIGLTINPNALLKSGDIIVADTAEDETAGKATELINVNSDVVAGLHTIVNRPKSNLFSLKYLGYFFNSTLYHNQLIPHMQGIKVLSLSKRAIDITIVIYPKDKQEQQRIAEALSNIDNLISSLSKMIEKKRLIKQGAMQQLLTGKKRLPGFDGEWEELLLGDYAKIYRGGSPRPIEQYITNRPDGINWIKIGDVSSNAKYIFKTEEKIIPEGIAHSRKVHKGDFILSNSMSYGRPYIVMIDGCIHDGWLVIKDYHDTFDMDFLYYVLGSDYIMSQYASMAAGSSVKNLNKEKVSNLTLYTPRNVKEQSAIAVILTTMDNEIESLEEERDKYIRLKDGMMQKLLTGQIRLIQAETKKTALPKPKVANVYFKRSVLAAEIADRLCEEKTFGHVKMEKLIFLTEHLCHIDIASHYHRDAAGPYDNTALRSIDSQMRSRQWFELTKKDKGYRYQPMDKRGEHKKYFDRYYTDVLPMFNKVIETFKSSTTEQCEIVATLYSAWDDLLHSGHPFTDDDILNEVLNNWHESKKRINRSRWQAALDWMRNNGFEPQNENN